MTANIEEMIHLAHKNLKRSYAPYSKFHVSSCIYSSNGNLFVGVNVENSGHSMAICAESSAICQMVAAGDRGIRDIVVLASSQDLCSPCGACRQRIHEFATEETIVHMCNKNEIIKSMNIDKLLPLAFKLKP